jgi:hypothetical protein
VKQRSDPFLKVQWEAEKLLQELGIDSLPIDPFAVAERLDIALRPMPANVGGASGMLIHFQGVFGIAYPTHIESDGFKRFSVGHEIGHYRLPGHVEAVLDQRGQHVSHAGFRSSDQYEQEADHFSAALLMPRSLVSPLIRAAREGLTAVETIAERCETSLEAAAIRYSQLCLDPVAVVRSEGKVIDYAFMSSSLKDFADLDWIRKGSPLPRGSATYAFNETPDNVRLGRRATGEGALQDWFGGPHRQEVNEEVAGLGSYGKTVTVLSGMEPPDEVEDEEDLEGSWTPRFHKR